MAVGDTSSDVQSIAAGAYLTLQPSSTEEWIIQNIYHEYDIQLEFYDGSNALVFDTDAGAGVYSRLAFRCTNANYIRIKNTHATLAKLIAYDGVISHT